MWRPNNITLCEVSVNKRNDNDGTKPTPEVSVIRCLYCGQPKPDEGSLHLEDCPLHDPPSCLACEQIKNGSILERLDGILSHVYVRLFKPAPPEK